MTTHDTPITGAEQSEKPLATVVIPCYANPPFLDEVLGAVTTQNTSFPYEVLVIDSGMAPEAVATAEKYGVWRHQIPNTEFSHGGTRQMAAEMANGTYVVFMTDDATPSHDGWLQAFVDAFDADPKVANVCGKQIPRPVVAPTIKRDIENVFRGLGNGGDNQVVYKIGEGEEGRKEYEEKRELMRFNSDTNAAYLREVLVTDVPFRHIDYAEDQLIGQDLLEAGYARVYSPNASVIHSHHYPVWEFLQRYYDEYRGLKEALNYVDRVYWHTLIPAALLAWKNETKYVWSQDYTLKEKIYWTWHAGMLSFFRRLGAILGGRHDKLPSWVKGLLSLEGRRKKKVRKGQNGQPSKLKQRYLDAKATAGHLYRKTKFEYQHNGVRGVWIGIKRLHNYRKHGPDERKDVVLRGRTNGYMYDFIYSYDSTVEDPFTPQEIAEGEKLTINWVIPDFKIGSGGHMTIFRMVHFLEKMGHTCRIYIFDKPMPSSYSSGSEARKIINKHFIEMKAQVFIGMHAVEESDITVATSWHTAYPVYGVQNTKKKFYFVQDFEPVFQPLNSEFIFAENTYKMGFSTICASPWLEKKMKEYGNKASHFYLAYDGETYNESIEVERKKQQVAFYARYVTPRRGFELGVLALDIVKKERPDLDIVFFGWDCTNQNIPFEYENRGVLSADELAALYNESTVGVVFSLTNYSLIPQEMMACGLPVVEMDVDSTEMVYTDGENVALAEPNPHAVAKRILGLLDSKEERERIAVNGKEWVKQFSWEDAAKRVERAFYEL